MKFFKNIKKSFIGFFGVCAIMASCSKKDEKAVVTSMGPEEIASYSLEVQGEIPSWLKGTLIRNGPIQVSTNGKSIPHWFDGLAMLHSFSFEEGKVGYTNRFLRSDAYKSVFEKGKIPYNGFATDPCRSLFKRFFTFFIPSKKRVASNANVNVVQMAEEYLALTETPLPVRFDPKTLETLGVFDYEDKLPKEKCWESAHPHSDPMQNKLYNYLIEFGKNSAYVFYEIGTSKERKILAKVPVDEPAYMHSFAMTEHYLILTEFPLVIRPLDLILKGKPFIQNFNWKKERGTRFILIDRQTGKIQGEYVTKPFFAFHHGNAFEKEGKIYLDIVSYADAQIITGNSLYFGLKERTLNSFPFPHLERFTLDLASGTIDSHVLLDRSIEFPRINEAFDGKPYRHLYLAGFKDTSSQPEEPLQGESLYKLDTETQTLLFWSEQGTSPGEPVFVPAPEAKTEDEGVVLSLVIDRLQNGSFLLILDGKSFQEIGRVRAPHTIPLGFHSQFFSH